jgi:hypothetical protein
MWTAIEAVAPACVNTFLSVDQERGTCRSYIVHTRDQKLVTMHKRDECEVDAEQLVIVVRY